MDSAAVTLLQSLYAGTLADHFFRHFYQMCLHGLDLHIEMLLMSRALTNHTMAFSAARIESICPEMKHFECTITNMCR